MADPLKVISRNFCSVCGGNRRKRKNCRRCWKTGFAPVTNQLRNLWRDCSAFLVGGGSSLRDIDLSFMRDRGVVSLGVNNVAGYAPVSAFTFGDPQVKFHHGIWLDPSVMKFVPIGKMRKHIRVKINDDFFTADKRCCDCPNVWGYSRTTDFDGDKFLDTDWAHWGWGGKTSEGKPFRCIATILLGFRLLCFLGVKKIYLLGVDNFMVTEQPYCFNQKKHAKNSQFRKQNEYFRMMKPSLDKHGVTVYATNPKCKQDVFDFCSLNDAIMDCKNSVPDEPFDLSGWYEKGLAREMREKHPEFIEI